MPIISQIPVIFTFCTDLFSNKAMKIHICLFLTWQYSLILVPWYALNMCLCLWPSLHSEGHFVIISWWRHQMETFPRYWPFGRGIRRSPVNSPHKGQWRRAVMFSLICAWINGWANSAEVGNLRHHRSHYDVTVMCDGDDFKYKLFGPFKNVTSSKLRALKCHCRNISMFGQVILCGISSCS